VSAGYGGGYRAVRWRRGGLLRTRCEGTPCVSACVCMCVFPVRQPSLQVAALEQQRKAYVALAASNADIVARVTALQASAVGVSLQELHDLFFVPVRCPIEGPPVRLCVCVVAGAALAGPAGGHRGAGRGIHCRHEAGDGFMF
jgi:hypothetical protein